MYFLLTTIAFLIFNSYCISAQEYVTSYPIKGKGVKSLLKHYKLSADSQSISEFLRLNNISAKKIVLYTGHRYLLPIRIFEFNGNNIRTTVGIDNYQTALSIQHYNDELTESGIKKKDFRTGKELWVPVVHFITSEGEQPGLIKIKDGRKTTKSDIVSYPIFGEQFSAVKLEGSQLEGTTFYLVSGHGGPDPGAIGTHNGHILHEDEYAYDVILRLGRKLIEYGADVEFIIQDPNDGIRNEIYLWNSHDETCQGEAIPLNQIERLHQRVNRINHLYDKNEEGNSNHHFISIHVDSRIRKDSQIDIFFYHADGSVKGERIADALRDKLEEKYQAAQPGRGYKGSVRSRGLYVIRKSKPVTTFIELGNIQNARDQKRILQPDNRQAIANWLAEGIIEYFSQ